MLSPFHDFAQKALANREKIFIFQDSVMTHKHVCKYSRDKPKTKKIYS